MKVLKSKVFSISILIVFFAIFMHSHKSNLHKDLIGIHMWRQTQTQLNIQQFYRNDFNILNPRVNTLNGEGNIKRFEFPIMQWLIAGIMKIYGEESLLITRLCIAFITFWSFIGIYQLAKLLSRNEAASLMTAGLYLCSPLVFYYGINPIPDNMALLCAIWFCYYFFRYKQSDFTNLKEGILSAIFISLSILAKLPYAIFGSMALFALIFERNSTLKWTNINTKRHIIIFSLALVPPLIWYGSIIHNWGSESIVGGIINGMSFDRIKIVLLHHWNHTTKDFFFNHYAVYAFYCSIPFTVYGILYSKNIFKSYLTTLTLSVFVYFIYELNMIDIIHDY
ncbi:MAG TPA: glycosyltransferase family 39 protein, partial [Saprospiraceae bacterium]|nr:glycosyltransferase family 39 protein [Saprospiraceae bacterium]